MMDNREIKPVIARMKMAEVEMADESSSLLRAP
ncbi:hypothetical protein SDC9_183573 [bioreactor metagenome]|uniref:Uncharacterized protein n=1 Tax=bioreactor metagenome TaxID=1076179 RepID=A0A645HAL5_9ZZZZ